ncbi:uncharacterized protein TNCV_3319081 [Trichonephila clavipes]|nr:uncharacterized protein TNCV_3319081 [Trichonephila clavipes]
MQTLPGTERLNLNSIYNALDLRFGQKYSKDYARLQMKTRLQKTGESLQEYASEVEWLTNLAFSDHPATVRNHLFTVFRGKPEGMGSPEGSTHQYRQSIRGARVTLDAPCESPWKSDIEKLRHEFQAFKAQRQNQENRKFKFCGCAGTGHLRRNCPRSRKDQNTVSSSKQEN